MIDPDGNDREWRNGFFFGCAMTAILLWLALKGFP
jgi:hypothetical protein